jgi:hypothetical protein
VVLAGTALYLDNGGGHARLVNYGLVESRGDDLFAHSSTGGGVLANRGFWRKTAGSITTLANGLWFIHGGVLEAFKGAFSLTGSAFVQDGGTMSFRLNSLTDYGQIYFAGVAPLGGGLAAEVTPGFLPAVGSQFQVIQSQGTNGVFASHNLAPAYTWSVLTTATYTRLTVTGQNPFGAPARFTRIEQVSANSFDLHLLVEPNRPYHLEARNGLDPNAPWQNLGSFSSATSSYTYRHSVLGTPPPHLFFRAVSP